MTSETKFEVTLTQWRKTTATREVTGFAEAAIAATEMWNDVARDDREFSLIEMFPIEPNENGEFFVWCHGDWERGI